MKSLKYFLGPIVAAAVVVISCEDNQAPAPAPSTSASALSANFLLINASSDGPSLDFYVNNMKVARNPDFSDATVPPFSYQTKYTTVPVTTNNTAANTNIRAKATSGSIGGVLGSNDLIFRAGNNNANNFQAADGGSYTVIVVDSINRPVPVRTLNSGGFGDITYYSSKPSFTAKKISDPSADTVIQLKVGSNNSIITANLLKKYNNNNLPSFFIPIGVVPLGSTDVGGLRFLLLTDELPLPSTTRLPVPTAGKFAVRFVNASPDAGTVTCKVNGSSLTSGIFSYPMTQANFNPSVGSRSTTASFKNDFAAAGDYDITVTVGANTITATAKSFADGGIYTIVLAGSAVKGTLNVQLIQNK
jgi:hypothetical protein